MINRIMLISAVVICIISAASTLLGNIFVPLFAAICISGVILCIVFRSHRWARSFAAALAVGLLFCLPLWHRYSNVDKTQALISKTANISGYVCEEPEYRNGYTVYPIKTTMVDVDGAVQEIKLNLNYYDNTQLDVFDYFTATVSFSELKDETKTSNYADGIYLTAKAEELTSTGTKHDTVYKYAVNLRRNFRTVLFNTLPHTEASIISGILLGDRSSIPDKLYSQMKECGIIHIVCVSGLHLSIICYALLGILKAMGVRNKPASVITAIFVVLIMAVTGFTPSVMRAAFMFLLMLLGRCMYQSTDSLNLLGASVAINMFINPFAIFSIALQLSALSTAGIIIGVPFLQKHVINKIKSHNVMTRLLKYVLLCVFQCVAATVATLPVTIASIGYISLIAPVVSVLLIYPASMILTLSLPAVIIAITPLYFLAYPLLIASGIIAKFFVWVVQGFALLPITTIDLSGNDLVVCTVICAVFAFIACSIYPNRRTVKLIAVMTAVILLVNVFINNLISSTKTNVSVVSTGSGYASFVVSVGHKGNVVVCSEMTYPELSQLASRIYDCGGYISVLIIPDCNTDMRREITYMLDSFTIYTMLIADEETYRAYCGLNNGIRVEKLNTSDIELWDRLKINVNCNTHGTTLNIRAKDASFSAIYPLNSQFIIPESVAESDLIFLYPGHNYTLPQFLKNMNSVITGSNISNDMMMFYGSSQCVTHIGSGDVMTFYMNKKIELN